MTSKTDKNKIKLGINLDCGGYDPWWVYRNLRHRIYNEFKQAVTDKLLDDIIKIIEQGE